MWFHGEIKSPPFSKEARVEAGVLLRRLQRGEALGPPQSDPLPEIGRRCHELRVRDEGALWRLIYRIDGDAIVIVEVFNKKTRKLPKRVADVCRRRLAEYDRSGGNS